MRKIVQNASIRQATTNRNQSVVQDHGHWVAREIETEKFSVNETKLVASERKQWVMTDSLSHYSIESPSAVNYTKHAPYGRWYVLDGQNPRDVVESLDTEKELVVKSWRVRCMLFAGPTDWPGQTDISNDAKSSGGNRGGGSDSSSKPQRGNEQRVLNRVGHGVYMAIIGLVGLILYPVVAMWRLLRFLSGSWVLRALFHYLLCLVILICVAACFGYVTLVSAIESRDCVLCVV
jgi:hypothetical protein